MPWVSFLLERRHKNYMFFPLIYDNLIYELVILQINIELYVM